MSDSLNKYCSEAKDLKDVKDAMNKIQKLRAQMKNPTRDGMIEALRDAKMSALMEISALEMAQGRQIGCRFQRHQIVRCTHS